MLRIALASSFGSTDTESDKPVRPPSPVISPTYSMGSLSYQEKYSESTSRGLVTKKSDALAKTWKYEDWCEDNNKIVDMTKYSQWCNNLEANGGELNPYLDLSKEQYENMTSTGKILLINSLYQLLFTHKTF